jgi:hypothetical protein
LKKFAADSALCVALAAATLLLTAQSRAGKPCDHVVSYFLFPYQDSQLKQYEWRIFDPSRRTDTLFLSLPGGFGDTRWDTTFDSVCFISGDSLYRVPWQLRAKPRLISKLPAGYGPWWFNPDSACWQTLRVLGQPRTDDPDYNRYGGELWQSTRDGATWRRIRADSVDLVDSDNDRWQWSDGSRLGREASVRTLDDLASESWEETWGDKTALIDTATITVTNNDGDGYASDQWFFLGLQSSPRRGVAFQLSGPLAPEHNWSGVLGPFYFVDLDRRTKKLVEGTDAGIMRSLFAEHCGFVLIPGVMRNPLVIDSAGHRVFSRPWNSDGAVWVHSPREF